MDDTHLLKHIKQAILVWSFRQNIFLGSFHQNCSIWSCYAITVATKSRPISEFSTITSNIAYVSGGQRPAAQERGGQSRVRRHSVTCHAASSPAVTSCDVLSLPQPLSISHVNIKHQDQLVMLTACT